MVQVPLEEFSLSLLVVLPGMWPIGRCNSCDTQVGVAHHITVAAIAMTTLRVDPQFWAATSKKRRILNYEIT
jgi:hypothetical protein